MVNVVTGPPCAGKSTYVAQRRSTNSVVVDFDAIAVALGAESSHMCAGDVKDAAILARRAVIKACHKYREVWVINTSLDAHDRDEFRGARFHDLDPGEDECVRRAVADGRPEGTVEAIHAWYARRGTSPNKRRYGSRYQNGAARRRARARLKARHDPCWICEAFGRNAAIDYDLPAGHPMSFEVDELIPVSKGGSPIEMGNLAATHRYCNEWRGNKSVEEVMAIARGETGRRRESVPIEQTTSIEW